jgi:hypothetical protein
MRHLARLHPALSFPTAILAGHARLFSAWVTDPLAGSVAVKVTIGWWGSMHSPGCLWAKSE